MPSHPFPEGVLGKLPVWCTHENTPAQTQQDLPIAANLWKGEEAVFLKFWHSDEWGVNQDASPPLCNLRDTASALHLCSKW